MKPALGIGDAVFAKDGVARHGKVPRLPLAAALLQGRPPNHAIRSIQVVKQRRIVGIDGDSLI